MLFTAFIIMLFITRLDALSCRIVASKQRVLFNDNGN